MIQRNRQLFAPSYSATRRASGSLRHCLNSLLMAGSVVAATAVATTPVLAQTSGSGDPAESTASTAQGQGDGGEIIVTAQRVSQRLQDVPLSVQAIGADALRDRGINELRQLGIIAPSLQPQRDNNFSIRGIGTQSFANTIESSVATAIDDVTLGSRFLNGNPLVDVERVEVLNGPQGLLFGKNASAGLVNITTVKPRLGALEAGFDAQATSNARPGGDDAKGAQARAILNIPMSDNSALRLNALYNYQEPTIFRGRRNAMGRNDSDFRQYGGRAKYLLEASDKLTIYLVGEYFQTRGVGTTIDVTYLNVPSTSANVPALKADGVTPGPRNFFGVTDAPEYRDLDTGGAQAAVSYAFDNDFTLSNTFAWKFYDLDQQLDADYTGQDGANGNTNKSNFDQFTNELRLTLPTSSKLSGQLGLYYFRSSLDQQSQIYGSSYVPSFVLPNFPFCVGATPRLPSPPNCSVSNSYFLGNDKQYSITNTSYAAFGQLAYSITDQLKIIAGGRYTHDRVHIDLDQNRLAYFLVLGVKNASYDQSYSNDDFSWKLGAQYNPTADVMLYANYGRGYKGPGMNDTGASLTANLTVYPETSKTAEIGLRSTFLDRAVTLNLTAFHTRFNNYQIQSLDANLRAFVIGNAARVKSQGGEATLLVRPVKGLTLNGSAAYADTKFAAFPGAQCYAGQPGCAANGTFDASGFVLPFAPKFTSTIGAAYEHEVGTGGTRAFIDASLYHRSGVETLVNQAPGSRIDAVSILNATLGLRGGQLSAAIFCKNCTNKVYPITTEIEAGDASFGNLTLLQRFSLDSTRTIGLRFGFNF